MENRQGEVKNNIGNVEAKELIYTTHGHELNGGGGVGSGWQVQCRQEGTKGRKNGTAVIA